MNSADLKGIREDLNKLLELTNSPRSQPNTNRKRIEERIIHVMPNINPRELKQFLTKTGYPEQVAEFLETFSCNLSNNPYISTGKETIDLGDMKEELLKAKIVQETNYPTTDGGNHLAKSHDFQDFDFGERLSDVSKTGRPNKDTPTFDSVRKQGIPNQLLQPIYPEDDNQYDEQMSINQAIKIEELQKEIIALKFKLEIKEGQEFSAQLNHQLAFRGDRSSNVPFEHCCRLIESLVKDCLALYTRSLKTVVLILMKIQYPGFYRNELSK